MTLAQIVDDILFTCRSIDPVKTAMIQRDQVEYWIRLYRIVILRQDINDNSIVDPTYVSVFNRTLMLNRTMNRLSRTYLYRSTEELPAFPTLTGRFGLLSVRKPYVPLPEPPGPLPPDWKSPRAVTFFNRPRGIEIPVGDEAQAYYMDCDYYNPASVGGWIENKYLMVRFYYNDPEDILTTDDIPEKMDVVCRGILSDPKDSLPDNGEIPYEHRPFPVPDWKLPWLKQMIIAKELQWLVPPQASAQSEQQLKMQDKETSNNPAVLMQEGADFYDVQ